MRRIALALGLAALSALALSAPSVAGGCVNAATPKEGTSPDVHIDKCQFQSAILRVPVGTTVKWTNDDFLPHVVSGIGWGQTQSMMMTGDTFTHAFTEAGVFPYTCSLHPGMNAVVFVGDVAAPTSQSGTVAAKIDAPPQSPATKSQDGAWLAAALLASIVACVTGFAAGRYLGR